MINYQGIYLYIDPGTGSMLVSVFIGLFASLWFVLKKVYIKFKYSFGAHSGVQSVTFNHKENGLIIFSDSKRYLTLFLPILNELDERNINAKYLTFDDDDPILNKEFKNIDASCIGKGNRAFSILNTLSSKILLSTTPSLDVFQWKKSKDVDKYVHILHEVGGANEYRMFGLAFFDSVLLTGDFQVNEIREIEKAEHLKCKELVVVGSPYMDYLQSRYDNYRCEKTCAKNVIVAPTWGKNGLLSVYGERLVSALLKTDYHIIIRPHPQSLLSDRGILDDLIKKYSDNERVEFNYDIDNFDVLYKSSAMISDYSGVIFDYSLVFNKPVLYASSEIRSDMNDSWFLDHEIYRYEAMRTLGLELKERDFDNLQEVIDKIVKSEILGNSRNSVRDILWQNRGKAAKAVVDYIEEIV